MVSITPFEEQVVVKHLGREGLKGFIYRDIFEPLFFSNLKNTVKSILSSNDRKTYLTHSTTFNVDGQYKKIISHAQSAREQHILFDLTFLEDWYSQTNESVKAWSEETICNSISPVFYKCIKIVENLEPLAAEKNDWVFYRLHLNYLSQDELLAVHIDAAPHITKSNPGIIDHRDARMYSITFYLYDAEPGTGGEIWTPYGFVFRPKENSAILLNGHQAFHGVTQNINSEPRMAFTMRLAHKDDLFLPGSMDKFLYDVSKNL